MCLHAYLSHFSSFFSCYFVSVTSWLSSSISSQTGPVGLLLGLHPPAGCFTASQDMMASPRPSLWSYYLKTRTKNRKPKLLKMSPRTSKIDTSILYICSPHSVDTHIDALLYLLSMYMLPSCIDRS